MNYEAVFVDWDGTLSNSRYWGHWQDNPEKSEAYDKIQGALFGSPASKELLRKWMIGDRSYKSIIGNLATYIGMSYGELEDELQYSAENMTYIDATALNMVQQLRDLGKHVVIATDNMDVFDKWTVPALNLHEHFDDIISSCSVRALKSDIHPIYVRSNFFHDYFREMGVPPSRSVLIDNSLGAKCLEDIGIGFMHVTDETPLTCHLQSILNEYK